MQTRSKRFCSSDADLTILSSNSVIFKVHRKNPELHSDIFADTAIVTLRAETEDDEPVKLSETSAPVNFQVCAELAEAAEKYVVYSALPAVMLRMKESIPKHPLHVLHYAAKQGHHELGSAAARLCITDHPLKVLNYAAQHDLKVLANEAARLSIALPISQAALTLSPNVFTKWMDFYDKWHAAARDALGLLLITSTLSRPDGRQPFLNNVSNIATCVRNPRDCYRTREALQSGFATEANSSGITAMAITQLKILDLEFMTGD